MSLRILSAWYKKDGIEKKINLSELTDEEYENKYDGYLFCPNRNCNARIIFASGNLLKYFRTHPARVEDDKIINEHLDDCPYSVEHEIEDRARRRRDPNLLQSVSPEHMRRVLRRAFEIHVNPEKNKKKTEAAASSNRKLSSRTKTDQSLPPSGRAGLSNDSSS